MDDDSCRGKKSSKATTCQNRSFQNQLEELFFTETSLGLGLIFEPNGRIHTIKADKGTSTGFTQSTPLSTETQVIPKPDIAQKLNNICKYAIISYYDSMGGSYFILYPCKTESELGEMLTSKVGIQESDCISLKRLAVVRFGKNPWLKKPEDLTIQANFSVN